MTDFWAKVRGFLLMVVPISDFFQCPSFMFAASRVCACSVAPPMCLCSCAWTGSLSEARRFALSLSRQRLWVVPALWAGPRVLSLAFSQRHPGYVPGLVLQWHFCALVHHSRETTFADLIFLALVFDHAYQPTTVRVSGLPGGTCEFLLLMLHLIL